MKFILWLFLLSSTQIFAYSLTTDPQMQDMNLQQERVQGSQQWEDRNLQQEKVQGPLTDDPNLQQERTRDGQFYEDQNFRQEKQLNRIYTQTTQALVFDFVVSLRI